MGLANFPFDIEGPNFATGALKVNPACKKRGDQITVIINVTVLKYKELLML